MENLESARSLLDQQTKVAIWYAEYEEGDESIRYANECFSNIFGIPITEILEKKRYHLVNPPDTTDEVIERYKEEDRVAMKEGNFLSRGPFEPGKDIVVVKLRFDRGMLGLFQLIDSEPGENEVTVRGLNAEILGVVRAVRPDLF